jgi:hypothetical protein
MAANGSASLVAVFVAFFVSNRITANSPQNTGNCHKHKQSDFACCHFLAPVSGSRVSAPEIESDRQNRQIQDSRVDCGVSLPVFGLLFNPFPANTPPNEPVKKIASVFNRSMKAASLGAWAEMG